MPDLLPDNEAAWELMSHRAVWKMGMNGPYAIDYAQVEVLARIGGFEIDEDLMWRIAVYEAAYLNEMAKDDKHG